MKKKYCHKIRCYCFNQTLPFWALCCFISYYWTAVDPKRHLFFSLTNRKGHCIICLASEVSISHYKEKFRHTTRDRAHLILPLNLGAIYLQVLNLHVKNPEKNTDKDLTTLLTLTGVKHISLISTQGFYTNAMKNCRIKQINSSNFLSLSLKRALLCQETWATNKSCSGLGSVAVCAIRTGTTEPAVAVAVLLKLQPNAISYMHTQEFTLWANASSAHKQPVTEHQSFDILKSLTYY